VILSAEPPDSATLISGLQHSHKKQSQWLCGCSSRGSPVATSVDMTQGHSVRRPASGRDYLSLFTGSQARFDNVVLVPAHVACSESE
ncbi:MAG: hypothetical protein ACODAD_07270, partial [Planctomycetota bacterium]